VGLRYEVEESGVGLYHFIWENNVKPGNAGQVAVRLEATHWAYWPLYTTRRFHPKETAAGQPFTLYWRKKTYGNLLHSAQCSLLLLLFHIHQKSPNSGIAVLHWMHQKRLTLWHFHGYHSIET
jgi:hypothetical protein